MRILTDAGLVPAHYLAPQLLARTLPSHYLPSAQLLPAQPAEDENDGAEHIVVDQTEILLDLNLIYSEVTSPSQAQIAHANFPGIIAHT